jgi:hypothetical protein
MLNTKWIKQGNPHARMLRYNGPSALDLSQERRNSSMKLISAARTHASADVEYWSRGEGRNNCYCCLQRKAIIRTNCAMRSTGPLITMSISSVNFHCYSRGTVSNTSVLLIWPKSSPLDSVLSQLYPVQFLKTQFSNIDYNLILPFCT